MTGFASRARRFLAVLTAAPLWLACADMPTQVALPDAPSASRAARDEAPHASATWQARATELVAGAALSPPAAVRLHALLAVAQYGAIVSIDFGGGNAQYAARRGAVAGASVQVLSSFFPSAAATLEHLVDAEGAAGSGNTDVQFNRGVAAGRAMGETMKAWARSDGFATPWNGQPLPTGEGLWTQAPGVAPAGFQFPTMRPYFLETQSQFRSAPPPLYGSDEFWHELAFVRHTTDSRTPEQAAIANRWNRATYGSWMARGDSLAEVNGLDERETTHVLALLGTAMLDANIACFDAKYAYQYIRPSQVDPLITRPAGTPGFPYGLPNHPSYPSAHSCAVGAATAVLTARFPRAHSTMSDMLVEAGFSRILGGLHFRFDVSAGQELGLNVGNRAIWYDHTHGLLAAISLE